MTKTITKRDGREVTFDRSKIASAVSKALAATPKGDDKELAESIAKDVERDVMNSTHQWGVEDIQDKVEYYLMASLRKEAAKAYIAYRTKRTLARKASTLKVYQSIVEAQANEVTRENANMNADTPAGMMMKFASEATKPFVDECLLSDDVREAVANNYIHIHDKDYYPTKSLTCLQHPLDKILEHGFQAGHGESRAAKRIETAAILACISMETVQNEMHGGQAIPAFDFYLAPYVKMTFEEEVKKLEEIAGKKLEHLHNVELDDYTYRPLEETSSWDERTLQSCINQTVWRVHQAMESFIHNMNTIHSRGGNQVVFSSINYGTDTSAEGRCVIREMLNCTYEGVGNGSTAIFPIQIWKKKRGVNYLPGDPNYDLFLLACRVSARRFFPNFLNLDAPFNKDEAWDANDPKRYMHEVATMGCVDGKEVITWRKDNKIHVTSFEEFWKEMSKTSIPESATSEGYSEGEFIDLNGIEIDDNGVFVDCLRVIKNPDKSNWMKVTLSNGRVLTATADHPWSILRGDKQGVVHTDKLVIGDEVRVVTDQQVGASSEDYVDEAWLKGFILCDGCYDGQMMSTVGLDETDIAEKYARIFESIYKNTTVTREQRRGVKGDYLELKNYTPRTFRDGLVAEYRGKKKIDRNIPEWVFSASYNTRAAFLAGMMDADGHINDNRTRTRCELGSTNKVMALQTAALVQSLGCPARIYENHYSSEYPDRIRYRVEFETFEPLLKYMASNKKKERCCQFFNPIQFNTGYVTKIEFIGFRDECSYDVTTSSEHFTVSGIRSHNCRTRVYENRFGPKTSVGRGNLSFTTINLVRLALESKENYIERLDSVLEIAAKQLHERFKFQQTALKKQFPLLMNGLWVGSDALKPTDSVADLLNQGTLGIGFIGLAETLVALTGKHHGESEEAQKLGLKIITHMRDKAIEFSERYGHNYSIIATPAEGLSGKFTKADKKKFGEIPGVTDREYYTNSNHVPVYYHCTPQHKAEVEAPYHALTLGGHIFYVEIDGDATHNPEAIKAVVDLMDRYGLGYGSVNHNRNRCLDCGYEDAQAGLTSCPRCGSHNIDVLQRITGYLVGTTERWNKAKLAELKDRVVHK